MGGKERRKDEKGILVISFHFYFTSYINYPYIILCSILLDVQIQINL